MRQRNREEVVNTQLALLVSRLGVTANAETIHVHGTHRPDVLFQLRGLRVVIEGKIADVPNAEEIVLRDARKRVRAGIAHIAAATVYPRVLRTTPTKEISDVLLSARLKYRIVAETFEGSEWFEGTPSSLMEALRRAQESLAQDDIVEKTAKALNIQLTGIAQLWMGQTGACDRLSQILGISAPKGEASDKAQERRETAAKVSALVLANALIFQEQLALTDGRVRALRGIEKSDDLVNAVSEHWNWIWENINYVPVFQLAARILDELPGTANTKNAIKALISEARAICEKQAALRHDLMGRIYHWLLHYAKYLGTYYTSVPAATLLLKLALTADWKQDFGDPVDLSKFKVADLACGTGTLLMAAAQAFSDLYIRRRAEENLSLEPQDLTTLHRTLMENVLHGYDVLPSAVHLTASTLALLAPDIAFVRMNLYVMPLGIDHGQARLGSLDFLDGNEVKTQMALDYSQIETIRTGAAMSQASNAKLPKLNLCVMNPPFVRSVGGNLLFGSLPDERGLLQSELKRRAKYIPASVTAGLGSVFVALADKHLQPGGRLAFVLPAALASGEAWGPTRQLIAKSYHLEVVVASHDADRPNFSENTDLSEVLFVARKLQRGEKAGRTKYVNLWKNPVSIHDSMHLSNEIENAGDVVGVEETGITSIHLGDAKSAELITLPPASAEGNWIGALFAQAELLRVAWHLEKHKLKLPGAIKPRTLPICKLGDLGALGPDRKRIHEGFKVTKTDWTPFAGFWGHDSSEVVQLSQSPNCRLVEWKDSPRGPHYGSHLWERAGNILLAERMRTNTQRIIAARFSENVLGNTWWSFRPSELSAQMEKALVLWLNSTLCILSFYSRRVTTEGAFVQMKQPAWASMPVLDVRQLDKGKVEVLADAYDQISALALYPVAQLDEDPVRLRIDKILSDTLKLPTLQGVRELLAREPGLTGRIIGRRL